MKRWTGIVLLSLALAGLMVLALRYALAPKFDPADPPLELLSIRATQGIVEEVMELRGQYSELSDFSPDCIGSVGLSLHYEKNILPGHKGSILGEGEACEIVLDFSRIPSRTGPSAILWGMYEIRWEHLKWQVSSYPACFFSSDGGQGRGLEKWGGRFIRSHNIELCKTVHAIVKAHLKVFEELNQGHVAAAPKP